MSSGNSSKEVILCRSVTENNDESNDYVKALQTAGYTCKHLPVLSFKFTNLDDLRHSLFSTEAYGGLIVTSRRTIEAIVKALEGHRLPDEWKSLPVFCVGPATLSFAEAELNLEACSGANCGNSKELADKIINEVSRNSRPLLYPCSAIARDTIEKILHGKEIKLKKIIVYETLPNEKLNSELSRIDDGFMKIFVFFSPSAVEFTLSATREKTHFMDNVQAVAIGPVTAEALVKKNIIVRAVSVKPEPEALLKAIGAAQL